MRPMRRFRAAASLPVLFACGILTFAACDGSGDQAGQESAPSSASQDSPGVAGQAPDQHAAADSLHGHASTDGGQALLPIMQKLGSEMTVLTLALMSDDYETVTRSAAAIAEHAPISAEELQRIHGILQADMAAFEAVDESVHVAAVRLHDASKARQPDSIVERLGEVQRGCVSCHTQFRERLRTNR